jgi:hypothetical protein
MPAVEPGAALIVGQLFVPRPFKPAGYEFLDIRVHTAATPPIQTTGMRLPKRAKSGKKKVIIRKAKVARSDEETRTTEPLFINYESFFGSSGSLK